MADQLEKLSPSGGSEDSSKRVQVAMKMIKSMGVSPEMLRSIITSWLVPQFKPDIVAELGQNLTNIHDVGFLGVGNSSLEGLRPYRMFDITDCMLVEDVDPSAPYCMVSHRWKDPEITLDLLRRVKKKVSKSYPTWYNTDRNNVEIILKYCKEKIKKQRKNINGSAVKNRLDEKLAQNECYVLSLLKIHNRSKKIRKEVNDAHAHLETIIRDKKVADMENRVFKDLNNEAKHNNNDGEHRVSPINAYEQYPAIDGSDEATDSIKAAYERVFDAEWERDRHSDNAKFDTLSRDLREMVEKMIRCLRLWRSAIKIEQSILKAGEIFNRGLIPGQKQQKSYVWLDTCCIDKSNHNEYSESMSLMGDWYAQSAFTLVHLDTGFDKSPEKSDAEIYWDEFLQTDGDYHKLEAVVGREMDRVQNYEDIGNEPEIEWSTRGWTLQELVMSRMTYYVNADWQFLHRPVENLGRAYHLIPYIGLYTNPLDFKPTPNAWKPEVLMLALLNSGAVRHTEAIKAVYPRIQPESDEIQIEDGFSLSNALLASIAMPWNLMDTVFHVAKPGQSRRVDTKVKLPQSSCLQEISVLWDQNLASQFPQIEANENDKEKEKTYKISEHILPQNNPSAEDKVSHALSIIKTLELVGFCFPKDISSETAKAKMAQAIFFATMGLIECYEQTQYPMVVQEIPIRESVGKKGSDSENKVMLKQKREIEKRVKLEIRKRLFQELLNSFPEAKEHFSIDTIEGSEEKEEAISKTITHVLHVLVDEVKSLILEDRQYIAKFGNITILDSWVEGMRGHRFTTQEVMALACQRKTTKPFDRAYSLMGILGVRFPTFPAEGYEKALCRLLDETIATHNDVSVFNWTGYNKGSSIRGRSMYPLTQEAYQAKDGRLYSRNSMSKVEKDKMLRTTSYYHAIVSLLRGVIEFLKRNTPTKQEVEWIHYIATIINSFELDKLKPPPADPAKWEKLGDRGSILSGTDSLPYEIEILSKFIGYIINGPAETASGSDIQSPKNGINNRKLEVSVDPDFQPVLGIIANVQRDDAEEFRHDIAPNTSQIVSDTDNMSPSVPTEVPLPTGDIDDECPPVGRKSRFVEQLSEAGSTPIPPITGTNEKLQVEGEIASAKDELTRYLHNWVTNTTQGMTEGENYPKIQLPTKVQEAQYKIEKQHKEDNTRKTSSFGPTSMISPHPIIVTNAGIEGIFDIQRVIITMADLQGLRQQVEYATSADQIISGYCSISTGFAQVIVQFSCKSGILRNQLDVIDGMDFRVMKEQNQKEGKKREYKMTSKGLWEKMKKDKKDPEERDGEKKKKKKDKRGEVSNNLEPDLNVSANLDDIKNENQAGNDALEGPQTRDLDEEKTINRMIKFIQEDDLRLVAGEWILARCSGVTDADWFLCHLELGTTHPFYGYRIPTSEIDFNNCTPEAGLVVEWNKYMNRKREEMCKILTLLLKSKERKLKRRRLVGRVMRDLAPLDEKSEHDVHETETRILEEDVTEERTNNIQHEYDYLDDFADDRNDAGREFQADSEMPSQDSLSSARQDDVWSAPLDPQSQYTASSTEAQDMWLNQELRPEDSVSNIGDQDMRPSQGPPTSPGSTKATEKSKGDEKSHFWDSLPLVDKAGEKTAKQYDTHLSATVLKDTPTVLRQAIENLNDNRDFLPAMFHSAKKIHMF